MALDNHSGVTSYARIACTKPRGSASFAQPAHRNTPPRTRRKTVPTHGRMALRFTAKGSSLDPNARALSFRDQRQVVHDLVGLVGALQVLNSGVVVRTVEQHLSRVLLALVLSELHVGGGLGRIDLRLGAGQPDESVR